MSEDNEVKFSEKQIKFFKNEKKVVFFQYGFFDAKGYEKMVKPLPENIHTKMKYKLGVHKPIFEGYARPSKPNQPFFTKEEADKIVTLFDGSQDSSLQYDAKRDQYVYTSAFEEREKSILLNRS